MVESLKQIKHRIRSIENTQKVTHAMEMVSIAKLRAIENRLPALRRYFSNIERMVKNLLAKSKGPTHRFLEKNNTGGKTALCVIASDSGLCGTYNNDVLYSAEDFINKLGRDKILLIAVGRKGLNYFKKRGVVTKANFIELNGRFSEEVSDDIAKVLTDIYISGEADEVYLSYTRFESLSRHRPAVEKLLNIELNPQADNIEYLLEPDADGILAELLPVYVAYKIKSALLNAFACEQASRMAAMGEATNNADELLDELVLSRNKLRQANITKEILEIISSSEALR